MTTTRPPWTRRQKLIAGSFVAWLAVQLAVPIMVLNSDPNPDPDRYRYRFGWQMYSGTGRQVHWLAKTADGRTHPIDAPDEVGVLWGNVNYGSGTASRLCDADPRRVNVIRYTLNRRGERKPSESFPCR